MDLKKIENIDESEINSVYDNEYFKLLKTLQAMVGLWPYDTGYKSKAKRLCWYIFIIFTHLPYANGVRIYYKKDTDLFCLYVSSVVFMGLVLFKFACTAVNMEKFKKVYKQLAINWLTLTEPEEREIMVKYANLAKLKNTVYVGALFIGGIGFITFPMIPIVLDFIIPLNESREKLLIICGEFQVEQEDYYLTLYIYTMMLIIIFLTAAASIDVGYTIVTHQTLGVYSVIKHRLMKATLSYDPKSNSDYNAIVETVRLHKGALEFIDLVDSSYSLLFLFIIGGTIIMLCVCAILGLDTFYLEMYYDTVRVCKIVITVMLHLFYLCWPGQMLIDHNNDLFISIYATEWYNISKKGKVLLRILMMRCMRPCMFTAGGMFAMNFENFGSIVKSSLTYVTAAVSMRDEN